MRSLSRTVILSTIVVSALAMVGCAAKNGSTTCGDWLSMTTSDQHAAVQNMLSDRNQSGEMTYLTTLGSVKLFCATHPDGATIDQIYRG